MARNLFRFVEMTPFTRRWKSLSLGDEDLLALQMSIMQNPARAPVISGTGGLRKVRFAPKSWRKGKSGSARVGYVYLREWGVVLLVIAYSKDEKDDLAPDEKEEIRKLILRIERGFESGAIRIEAGAAMKKTKPRRGVGAEIISGLRELAESLERREPISERFNCRVIDLDLRPGRYDPRLVKQTRELLHASQVVFARFLGVSVKTVASWEQGVNTPSGMARRFMDEIRANPAYWMKRLRDLAVAK
jgi:putative transcriptional regulator